jgi:hypothetical protein
MFRLNLPTGGHDLMTYHLSTVSVLLHVNCIISAVHYVVQVILYLRICIHACWFTYVAIFIYTAYM